MILTKDQFAKSLAADFSAAVEATYQGLIKAAVLAEREACADLCEQWDATHPQRLAEAIRARGTT